MPYTQQPTRRQRFAQRIAEALSFNKAIRRLSDRLSRRVEQTEERTPDLLSHPGGFTRAIHKRRIGIAEAYIRITRELDKADVKKRLHALKTLVNLSLHAKTIRMPVNTARVQIEIMKYAVSHTDNPRRRMERIADFALASYGHEAVIRRFLRELHLIEVPETGQPLREISMGWDHHVHDHLTEGRKSPSQVVLDAFIRGISRLTIAYYDLPDRDVLFEATEAGRILGIDVTVGIEFSVGRSRDRRHYLFIPPARTYDAYLEYFSDRCRLLSRFLDGLEENRLRRHQTITGLLEGLNTALAGINAGYEDGIYTLPPLTVEELDRYVPHRQYSRNHLAALFHGRYREVLRRRVLAWKVQFEVSRQLAVRGTVTEWELERVAAAYRAARESYVGLTPGGLRERWLPYKNVTDYDSAFAHEADVLPELAAAGGEVILNRPLEHGLRSAMESIIRAALHLDAIELFNIRDHGSAPRNPEDLLRLADFVDILNNGDRAAMDEVLQRHDIRLSEELITRASARYRATPLIPVAGSAATDWEPEIPGMGFVRAGDIPARSRKTFVRTHLRLPGPVSRLILGRGRPADVTRAGDAIYAIGERTSAPPNRIGDEYWYEPVGPRRLWRYLNPAIKNTLRVLAGIVPAWLWIGPIYTVVWLGITFFRNVFVDLVALSGTQPGAWSIRHINFDNTAQSLFWTGFSVPILGGVKWGFDVLWPLAPAGALFEWSRFFCICIANGLYIAGHNTLRHFEGRVIRANFFRSVLAWPFAAVSAPLGNLLGVPSIVWAKFWSDAVAAVIEGTGKYRLRMVLRRRDLNEIMPLLHSEADEVRNTAMLDLLYIWAYRQRGRTCLARILKCREGWGIRRRKSSDATCADHLDRLMARFSPREAQVTLTEFVLRKYTAREVILLTDLVRTHLVPFHDWLGRLRPKGD